MSYKIWQDIDFINTSRIINLPNPSSDNEAATKQYVDNAIEGLNWKESVKVASQSNINLSSPSSSIDGISLVLGDRILIKNQTNLTQNGIYIFDTAFTPLTRSLDCNSFPELEQAIVTVQEGTSSGTSYRQTELNGTIGLNDILWVTFGTVSPDATEGTKGIAEIATQSEVDTGTDDSRFITPLKLATWSGRIRKLAQNIGDGVSTSYNVTHNFNTRDVKVSVYYNSGNYDEILCEIQRPSVNMVTVVLSTAPTLNQFRIVVMG